MAYREHQGCIQVFCVNNSRILKRRYFTKFNMPDSVIKKLNAYGYSEFLNRNKKKFDFNEEDDLNNMMAQQRLYPNIPAKSQGLSLESDYHLPIPAEEEEIINENATS